MRIMDLPLIAEGYPCVRGESSRRGCALRAGGAQGREAAALIPRAKLYSKRPIESMTYRLSLSLSMESDSFTPRRGPSQSSTNSSKGRTAKASQKASIVSGSRISPLRTIHFSPAATPPKLWKLAASCTTSKESRLRSWFIRGKRTSASASRRDSGRTAPQ